MKRPRFIHPIIHNKAFTLVEIMIVVAIIALLAAIAVPGFLRARKRSQATAILNDARVLDGAKDQYAIENNRSGGTTVNPNMLSSYLKPGTLIYTNCAANTTPQDLLGNNYTMGSFDVTVKVNSSTTANFTDVIDSASVFWGSYGG